MSVQIGYRLTGNTVAVPHVALAKTIGRHAVELYRSATPIVSGDMAASWYYAVERVPGGIMLTILNRMPYAAKVVRRHRDRFRHVPGRLRRYAQNVLRLVE